jgi:MATE family multidrug resistance protein
MTSIDKIERGYFAAPGDAVSARGGLALEFAETFKLALPIALTQLGQIAMMTTDLALIGRLGDQSVAAAALAHTVFFVCFTLGMGLVSAVAPLAAQAFGARDPRMVRRSLRIGLWTALMFSVPMTVIPLFGEQILALLGQDPATAHISQRYLYGLVGCLAPGLCFHAMRGFMGAVNRPGPSLWITLAAIPTNGLLGYVLIFGHLGLPRLDVLGAGLATTVVNFGMCGAALWFITTQRPFRKFHVLGRFWRFDGVLLRQLVIIGGPISLSFLMEFGLFSAAAPLMGIISTTALAAHQIALQIAAILFMVPFGISMAATVRVGHAVGRAEPAAVWRAGLAATMLGIVFMSAMTLAVIIGRYDIARLFFGVAADASSPAVELTASLLIIGATFFVADGVQTIAAGALRGLNDTRIPLLFAAISYWPVGFTTAVALGFYTTLGAIGVWIGLSVGTAVYATLLLVRFRLLSRRLPLGMTPVSS